MEYSKTKIILPALKILTVNFALGFVSPGLVAKSTGFWWYFSWLHILAFFLFGLIGNLIGIGGIKSKLKFRSHINQKHCFILWRTTFFTALIFVTAWITVLLPHLINLINKELITGILFVFLYVVLILGAAIIVIFASLPKLWAYGSVFLLFFNRINAVAILSTITFIGFSIGYQFGKTNL